MELKEEQQKIAFGGKLSGVAEKYYQANTNGALDDQFFAAYKTSGLELPTIDWVRKDAPAKTLAWMKDALKDTFSYREKPPRWKDEAHWLYFKGKPMEFLHQFSVPDAKHDEAGEIYVFFAENPGENGKTVVYKMVKQTKKGEGTELINYAPFTDEDE